MFKWLAVAGGLSPENWLANLILIRSICCINYAAENSCLWSTGVRRLYGLLISLGCIDERILFTQLTILLNIG